MNTFLATTAFAAVATAAFAQTASTREAFLKLIDRPRVPLAAQITDGTPIRFSYTSEAGQRVPGVMVKPAQAQGKLPVVIALHGTGGTKESQLPLLNDLAGRGFLAIAIDGRYHGERSKAGKGSADYAAAMLRRFRTGKELPFLYDTVWDVLRLVDFIETLPDADASRIGMIGFSKGGMEIYLASAVDERIRASVPCIGVQSFRWALDNNAWQSRAGTFQAAVDGAAADEGVTKIDGAFLKRFYDRVAPGVYSDFDGPAMAPLIAPRPLLMINGDSDARTPLPGLMLAVDATRAAYNKAGVPDKFQFLLQKNTGHKVNPDALEKAIQWLLEQIGPDLRSDRGSRR